MEIAHCTLADVADVTGTVVVIDVLRAFSTAAVALSQRPRSYRLVGGLDEARALREADPDVLLVGEEDGRPPADFDCSNSPVEMDTADVAGRALVHRSSAGTQGVVRAVAADRVLAASFLVAQATSRALRWEPRVTFCITGADDDRDGDEDRACADYIARTATTGWTDPQPYLDRIPASTAGRTFGDPALPWMRADDLGAVQVLDRFHFAMEVRRGADGIWLERREPR